MRSLALVFTVLLLSPSVYGFERFANCMFQYTKVATVMVADTLPVTSLLVDDFVDNGNMQKGDDEHESAAEFLGGGVSFAMEAGIWLAVNGFSQDFLPLIPSKIRPYTLSKVPYRSSRLQLQKSKMNCRSN